MINLVEVSRVVNLHELLEHRFVDEGVTPMATTERPKKQKFSLQPIDLQEPYIALVDMGMI